MKVKNRDLPGKLYGCSENKRFLFDEAGAIG